MDTNKLRYYIADRKKSLSEFGNALCISHSALHRKMKGETEFTRKEIQTTITFLNLSCNEVMDIFFCTKSLLKETKG
ncbi:MAG: hypothetical protein K1W36_06735 [Lachnospiraceae bacterium]|nr:BetR domain protein [Lachnospiraceae bacterium]